MKQKFVLYKSAIYSYLIDPLFYVASLLTVFFCVFRFFYAGKFFVAGFGSTDLRFFFLAIPYISILMIPLLVFRMRSLLFDDSLPILPFFRFLSLNFAAFSVFAFSILLLISIPVCVSFFGTVDFGQAFSGFLGIFFYGFCAICLSSLFFEIFSSSPILPVFLSSIVLALVNFLHLLPLYFQTGSFLTFLCRKISFAWHFDSFSKGILDSKDFSYYIIFSLAFILLSVCFEYKRLGKKISKYTVFLFSAILILLSLSSTNLYFRLDLTFSKQFSVSETTKNLLSNLDSELRITYFRSKELKDLYPQIQDVTDFLLAYAQSEKNISLVLENADSEKLKSLGIQGEQIRSDSGSKTEFVTVYSAVLLQYLEKSALIPFVLSTNTLEYDLTQRIQTFLTQKTRKAYLMCGNGRDLSESYMYVSPWLTSRGFETEELNDFSRTEILKNLTADDTLILLGTKEISAQDSFLIQNSVEKGTKLFIATSPFHITIEDEWKISKIQNDSMVSYLNGKGFAFDNSLVEDISCYPLTMESGEGSNAEYVTVNYPLWVVLQNQKEAMQGLTVFWASPIVPYGDVEPLLFTTNLAWVQRPAQSASDDLFLTNPFTIPKSASASDSQPLQFIVAARDKNISLISDQFFVSSLMTGFISGESTGDFRNYDYLTKELLILRGENELAKLMQKSAPNKNLHKIVDEARFLSAKTVVLVINCLFLPLCILLIFIIIQVRRKNMKFSSSSY